MLLPADRQQYLILFCYCLAVCGLVWIARFDPFFWDTVQLGSKHAHFFFENGLRWAPLPVDIDSGHPPFLGYYQAIIWTMFGKTLVASHLAMLPFVLLNTLLLWRIGIFLSPETRLASWLPLLAFADPVLLTQSMLISPDILVVSGFLMALYGLLSSRNRFVAAGTLLLCLVSMRGMMTATALFIWSIWRCWPEFAGMSRAAAFIRLFRRIAWPFLPGFVVGGAFLLWHWHATGWIGFHAGSPWAHAFQKAEVSGMLRNVAVLVWRWVDLGRVGELLLLFWLWCRYKLGVHRESQTGQLFILLLLLFLFLSPSAILYRNLSAHRYFLPEFILVHVIVFQIIVSNNIKNKSLTIVAIILILFSGNWWIYPRGVSLDWDCVVTHRAYHDLRKEAVGFLESRGINKEETGSAFPNLNTGEMLMLDGDKGRFAPFDLDSNRYVLCSNIFNDFSQKEYQALTDDGWTLVWKRSQSVVWMELYAKNQRPDVQTPGR